MEQNEIDALKEQLSKEFRDTAEEVYNAKAKELQAAAFEISKHVHNGNDAPRINQVDIEPGYGTSGSMTFATNGRRYRIKLPSAPTRVFFNGVTTNVASGGSNRFLNIGTAFLGKSFYLQADSVDSVVPGPYFNVVQNCTTAGITGIQQIRVHEGHLVRTQDSGGTTIAELTIPSYAYTPFGKEGQKDNRGYLDGYLYVDCYLATGYQIVGNIICQS